MENGNDSGDGPAAGVSNDHLLSSTPQTDLAETFTDNPCKRDFSLKKKTLSKFDYCTDSIAPSATPSSVHDHVSFCQIRLALEISF